MAACAALLAGCYSMDVATNGALGESELSMEEGAPLEHVVVSNYGWFLFNAIPLACGNAEPDAILPWKFLSNQVKAELLHDRIMLRAADRNADVKDLAFFLDKQVTFDFPGTNFSIPVPYLLCYKEVQFSGVLTARRKPASPDGGSDVRDAKRTIDEMNRLLDRLNPETTK